MRLKSPADFCIRLETFYLIPKCLTGLKNLRSETAILAFGSAAGKSKPMTYYLELQKGGKNGRKCVQSH